MKKMYNFNFRKATFAILGFVFVSMSTFAQWTQTIGPGGGIAEIIKVTSDGKFIIGSRGGIFISPDSGQTWAASNTGIEAAANIVCMDTVGTDIYIGTSSTFNYKSYKSSDNGASWTEIIPSPNFFTPYYITHNGNRIYFASGSEVRFSDDGGSTWDSVSTYLLSPDSVSMPNISMVKVIGNELWVGAYDMGLCKSSNNGATWVHADGGLSPTVPASEIYSTGSALFISAQYNHDIYTSTDNGVSWNLVTYPNPTSNGAYIYADNNDIYILCEPHIYKSSDNGSTWSTFSGSVDAEYRRMGNIGTTFLTGTNFFGECLYISTDNGSSWGAATHGFADTRALTLLTDATNLFVSTYDRGTFITYDEGNNYTRISVGGINDGFSANDIVKVGNEIVEGGYHWHYRSSNNGATWTSFINGMPNATTVEYCVDGNVLYAATDDGLYKSTNFGTWSVLNNGLPDGSILDINTVVKSGNRLFIAGDSTTINFDFFGVCYYSDDDGATWTNFSNQFTWGSYSEGRKMYVVGSTLFFNADTKLYSSTDNGASWNLIGNGLPVYSRIKDYYYDGSRLYVTMNGGVFASSDMGQNFTDITENLYSTDVHSITALNGYLYIGTEWGGVWKKEIASITVGEHKNVMTTGLAIYPNPAGNNFSINTVSGRGYLQIIALTGEIVYQENIKSNTAEINTSKLNNGIYYVQLIDGDTLKTSKLVISK